MDILELVRSEPQLASLPEFYYELRKAVEDPDRAFTRIEQIVLQDPQLKERLLKIVNSAFYSLSRKIETIPQAASIIGTDQLSYLVLSIVVMGKFKKTPDASMMWRHGIACGLIARKLAEYAGRLNSEKYFISTMLHDIGCLVMHMTIPHRNEEILVRSKSENKPLHLVEMNELGFNHAQAGGALLREWKLPQVYQEVAEYHPNPMQASLYQYETALCHLSDIIANTLKLGCSGESFIVQELDEKALALVSLPNKLNLKVIKNDIEKNFAEVVEVFLGTGQIAK